MPVWTPAILFDNVNVVSEFGRMRLKVSQKEIHNLQNTSWRTARPMKHIAVKLRFLSLDLKITRRV